MKLTTGGYLYPDEKEWEMRISHLLTPQEQVLMGGSPTTELCRSPEDFYKPVGVLRKLYLDEGGLSIKEAMALRSKRGYFNANAFSRDGIKGLAIGYPELDPETGEAKTDAEVLGELDLENQVIIPHPERDLTKELYALRAESLPGDPEMKNFKLTRENTNQGVSQEAKE